MDHDIQAYAQKEADNANEAGEATENCLRNAVIVRTILQHFSTAELRKLSFVNKAWKYEAQSVLRKRGHFTAYLKSKKKPVGYRVLRPNMGEDSPRDEVDEFISYLKQVNPVPFSGISLDVCFDIGVGPSPTEALDPLEGVILDVRFLKTVSVKLHGLWLLINMKSPRVLLAKKILQACSGVLEELSLCIDYGRKDFVEHVVHDLNFPQLKILKLMEGYSRQYEEDHVNYMKALLSRAPNLNMLHTNCPMNLMLNLLQGSSVVHLYVYTSPVAAPFDEIQENDISAIRLDSLELKYTGLSFDFERFNRITPMLLEASCTTTLRSMWLDAVLAVPLMSYGISLKNVKHLNMDINYEHLERYGPRILSIVTEFDFTRIFPNLNKVEVVASHCTPGHMNEVMEQADANLREPLLDRAANVNKLYLKQRNLSSEAAQYFAEMFPNIEKLEIITTGDEVIPFESIWKNWPDLIELKVEANLLRTAVNLDSVFCGIFPEEVANLRLRYDEYLKRVNIVPVLPALTCLKNLRVLSLNLKQPRQAPFGDDATFLFSEVTPLLAFARCPALTVTLKVSHPRRLAAPPAMAHLMPYVSITYDDFKDLDD